MDKVNRGFKKVDSNVLELRYEREGVVVRFITDWTPFTLVNTEATAQIFLKSDPYKTLWEKTVPFEDEDKLKVEAFEKAAAFAEG
jgi:hypothetical protein